MRAVSKMRYRSGRRDRAPARAPAAAPRRDSGPREECAGRSPSKMSHAPASMARGCDRVRRGAPEISCGDELISVAKRLVAKAFRAEISDDRDGILRVGAETFGITGRRHRSVLRSRESDEAERDDELRGMRTRDGVRGWQRASGCRYQGHAHLRAQGTLRTRSAARNDRVDGRARGGGSAVLASDPPCSAAVAVRGGGRERAGRAPSTRAVAGGDASGERLQE